MLRRYSKQEKHQNYLAILEDINSCETEDELDDVSDTIEQFLCYGKITKIQAESLEEEIEARISYLVALEKEE